MTHKSIFLTDLTIKFKQSKNMKRKLEENFWKYNRQRHVSIKPDGILLNPE